MPATQVPNGPTWNTFDRLKTHCFSHVWKPLYRMQESNCCLVFHYFAGMAGYSLAISWRLIGLAKDIVAFGCALVTCVVSLGCCGSARKFLVRTKVMCGSIAEVFNAVVGVVCPPLAYYLDECLLRDRDIAAHQAIYQIWLIPGADGQMPVHDFGFADFDVGRVEEVQIARAIVANNAVHAGKKAKTEAEVIRSLQPLRYAIQNALSKVPDYSSMPQDMAKAYALGIGELLFDGKSFEELHGAIARTQEAFLLSFSTATAEIEQFRKLGKEVLMLHLENSIIKDAKPDLGDLQKNYDAFVEALKVMGANLSYEQTITKALLQ